MKFDTNTGIIEFTPKLILRPGITRKEIKSMNANWEDWSIIDGAPRALRCLINMPNKGISKKTVLIVHAGIDDRPLAFWDVAPWDLADGSQNRPEGKYTKRMRAWFKEMFNTNLPAGGEWGHIDSSYDPWNQSTGIICNYRERFNTEKEWLEYRSNNNF